MIAWRWLAAASLAASAIVQVGWSPLALAAAAGTCPVNQAPTFSGGFAELKARLADWQGEPLGCEYQDPSNDSGDVLQQTTTGLAVFRQTTATPTFTNGVDHWALAGGSLVYWNGASSDPPADATLTAANPCLALNTCREPVAGRDALPLSTPVLASTPTPESTFPTANGPRSAAQLQAELASIGYAGPWDAASMLAVYGRTVPRIAANPDDTHWSCQASNSSCAADPWWMESNASQDATSVTYTAIGSGFSTERRYAEAINLLWQWPEGKTLLRSADAMHALVLTLEYDEQIAYATFVPERGAVAVNRHFTGAPTWMLTAVLAHELQHALDHAHNVHDQNTPGDCLARENAAFGVEQRFVVWLSRTLRPEGLPSVGVVAARLSPEHALLARDLYFIGFTTDLQQHVRDLYQDTCRL